MAGDDFHEQGRERDELVIRYDVNNPLPESLAWQDLLYLFEDLHRFLLAIHCGDLKYANLAHEILLRDWRVSG